MVQFDVVGTRRWSKTTQRPQIPLVWYLWIGNWTTRSEIVIAGLEIFFERQRELGYEGKGLAYWAEQASEHCHHDWNVTWQGSNYARALGHDDY